MMFRNREEAGRLLAEALREYRGQPAVVYALPRGGVALGSAVAKALGAPLGLLIPRKIGHPLNPEYAICALAETGQLVCDEAERALVDPAWLAKAVERERRESERRRQHYFGGRLSPSAAGKIAILVDDGIATGLTMRAAIQQVKTEHPRAVVVAIPIIPPDTAETLQQEVDRVVALDSPVVFLGAVGAYYQDFHPVSDEEVIRLMQQDPVTCFHLPIYRDLGEEFCRLHQFSGGAWTFGRFPNDEMFAEVRTDVQGAECLVVGAIAPPDDHLLTTLLLCHTLRQHGARRIRALIPYLAYMRQDAPEGGRSLTPAWVGALLQAAGVTMLFTVDIHSVPAMDALPIPVVSVSPAALYAEEIHRLGWQDAVIVAPDAGACARADAVRRAADIAAPLVVMAKERRPDGVTVTLNDNVGRRAIVIDDILDTGHTLVACCEELRRAGVDEILVMVTHGLFTGSAWTRLWDELDITHLYTTDTVPLPPHAQGYPITRLSTISLLTTFLADQVW